MPLTDERWIADLHAAYDLFAPLLKQDLSLSVPYALLSGAILWTVRDAEDNPEQRARLIVAGCESQLPLLLRAVRGWDMLDPLTAARSLQKRGKDMPDLSTALDVLLDFCRDDMLTYKMIQPPTSSISMTDTTISGGNILIGSSQYVAGDLIIQYIQPKAERQCPKPLPPPTHFGGRDHELATIAAKLRSGETVALTALNGVGGVGKTTLARQLAHDLYQAKVFRAVLWADVTRTPNAGGILREWAVSYADSSFSTENLKSDNQIAAAVKTLLDDVIAEKCEECEPPRVLVVLDDVWDNGLDATRLLQTACPDHATVLLTTRSENLAKNLHASTEFIAHLTPIAAAALLQTYLPAADPAQLQQLGAALGGHALALEIAARRVDKESTRPGETLATALKRSIDDYQRGIVAGTAFADLKLEPGEKREDNLTTALSLSYEDLADDDKARFRAGGILAYDVPFDRSILATLWNVPTEQVDDLADNLRLLSLLQADATGYRQHPLLRTYARALLTKHGETETVFARYTDFINKITENFYKLPPENWGQLTHYLPHINAVGNGLVARTQSPKEINETLLKQAQLFAMNTSRYLANRREVRQLDWTEMGLAVSRQLQDASNEARFLHELGAVYSALGDKQRALDYYPQALPLHQAVGNKRGEASTLNSLGTVYSALGDKQRALDYYAQALPLHQAVGDKGGEAVLLSNIGGVYSDLGDKQRALDYYAQALPLRQAVGDKGGEAITLNNIGRVYSDLGDKQRALDYYAQALLLHQAVGDKGGEAVTLSNIGGIHAVLGDKQRALNYFAQALPLRRAVGAKGGEAVTLSNIGKIYSDLGDGQRALDYYTQALPLRRAVGDKGGEAVTLNNIGGVYNDLGNKQRALNYFAQALPLHQAIGDKGGEAVALNNIGAVYDALGDKQRALDYYAQALPLHQAIGDKGGEAATLSNIGAVYDALGDKQRALEYYAQALPLHQAIGDKGGEAVTCFNIGMVHGTLGDLDKAVKYLARCVELDEHIGDPNLDSDRRVLEQWKQERDAKNNAPTPPAES